MACRWGPKGGVRGLGGFPRDRADTCRVDASDGSFAFSSELRGRGSATSTLIDCDPVCQVTTVTVERILSTDKTLVEFGQLAVGSKSEVSRRPPSCFADWFKLPDIAVTAHLSYNLADIMNSATVIRTEDTPFAVPKQPGLVCRADTGHHRHGSKGNVSCGPSLASGLTCPKRKIVSPQQEASSGFHAVETCSARCQKVRRR